VSSSSTSTETRSYGSGARILSIGIASTGLLTFAYFSIASHVLGEVSTKRIDLLWSVMFVIISVIYRPIEQLLSRTIADRQARGHVQHQLRVPITIQLVAALVFLVITLILHGELVNHVFDHYGALYDVLVIGTLAYAASYFARGWLAGHKYFALYGGLVLMESVSRICFALAVALGISSGQTAVALGIAAGPFVSLLVIPAAFARRGVEQRGRAQAEATAAAAALPADAALPAPSTADEALLAPITVDEADAALSGPGAEGVQESAAHDDLSLRRGTGFAFAVSGIMLSEQTLLNAAVLTVDASSTNHALAGVVFNVLLIARAPLQLFQAIQTSLLPHLAGLEATEGREAFGRAIRVTVLAIGGFSLAVTLGLLAIGPFAMGHLFGQHYSYNRLGLALVGIGMGLHLTSGALNQAALARNQARAAALCWLVAAVVFLAWMITPAVGDQLLRTEIGYCGAAGVLALALTGLYKRGAPAASVSQSAFTERAIAR
jgi:O-antigen/teichoic acid export membrane protein